ncbi:MAG: IS110 family transposase [Acidobacteriota bacterium]|nr:IS110 family transposase [Acidobacteriota bacterium]
MDVLIERGAGIDVHKKLLVVCLLIGQGNRIRKVQKRFGTFKANLIELRDWLVSEGCTHVVMESTSVYWLPVYEILEGHVSIVVGNAQHIKNVPGRKTDTSDAEWLAKLLRFGLVRSSYVPPKSLRELRQLTRYRTKATQTLTREKNRVQGLLETANIKLASVASDIFGASGRDMLEALIQNKSTPEKMALLARNKMKKKIPELTLALDGTMNDHHRALLRIQLGLIDKIDASIAEVELAIGHKTAPYAKIIARLDKIPGIDCTAAVGLLAEMGPDMSVWRSDGHLTAWAGLCPGNHESAGRKKNIGSRKGNPYLKCLAVQIATAAVKTNGTYYQAKYQRLAKRRGHKRAIVAIARMILVTIYHLLTRDTDYKERTAAALKRTDHNSQVRHLTRRFAQIGFDVALTPISA